MTNNPKQLIYCTVEVIETETGEKQNIIFDGIDNVYQYKTGVLMLPCTTIAFSITVRVFDAQFNTTVIVEYSDCCTLPCKICYS